MNLCVCYSVVFLLVPLLVAPTHLPRVQTPYGEVQGTYDVSYNGLEYSQFIGVPYAQPPIGKLRFAKPQPLEKWSGTWNANVSTQCLQVNHSPEPEGGNLMGQEDCLYVNIFTPTKNPTGRELFDVFVHFHSGGFNFGYGNSYGPKYLMDISGILVTVNYRLGALGFLSMEDEVLPGNNGMKDQSASLRWIKENIAYFGGNPDSITVTGLSAGGASTHYHYLSPLSKGLFHRGISVSGNALGAWTLQEDAAQKARRVAASLGCPTASSVELVNCLRQRPAVQVVESVRMFRPWLYNPFAPFGVVIEKTGANPFLTDHPYVLLSQGKVQDLPWITSVTCDEGLYPGADYAVKDHYLPDLERRWEELASAILDYNHTLPAELHTSTARKVKEYYLKGKPIGAGTYNQLIQMVGDRHFVVSADKSARLQAKANKSPVYFYYFTYMGEKVVTYAALWSLSEKKYGVSHGDDMAFVLSIPSRQTSAMTTRDERMKDILLGLWRSFGKTSIPELKGATWKPVSPNPGDDLRYLHIKSPDELRMEVTADLGHRAFWDTIPFREDEYFMKKVKTEL
ncbi:venom carboxylesterase-6-like [Photinus pyralis]|nr:venom carboxylesterase-6-like [Photinus pyralis]